MGSGAGDSDEIAHRELRSECHLARKFLPDRGAKRTASVSCLAANQHATTELPRAQRVWQAAFLRHSEVSGILERIYVLQTDYGSVVLALRLFPCAVGNPFVC